MRKIALIFTKYKYLEDREYSWDLIDSITDWVSVSEEDYQLLLDWTHKIHTDAWILEQPLDQRETISNTIAGCLELARKDLEKYESRLRKEQETIAKRAETRRIKALEKARILLEQEAKNLNKVRKS